MEAVVEKWIADGAPYAYDWTGVPHEVKIYVVQTLAQKYGADIFVETGTAHGAMTRGVQSLFNEVYTIEMMKSYHDVAKKNLAEFKHVTCLLGDSAKVLAQVVPKLNGPALFFLDAHYSGPGTARGDLDTPIVRELEIIAEFTDYSPVVVIDDARLFAGEEYHSEDFADYPSLEWITEFAAEHFQGYRVWRWADEFIISPAF
jgi:hypothetical protein